MILTILITIYILSFLRMYRWTKNAYSKDGIMYGFAPEFSDFLATIFPGVNTLFSFIVIKYSWTGKLNSKGFKIDLSKFLSKFFNIKK